MFIDRICLFDGRQKPVQLSDLRTQQSDDKVLVAS